MLMNYVYEILLRLHGRLQFMDNDMIRIDFS